MRPVIIKSGILFPNLDSNSEVSFYVTMTYIFWFTYCHFYSVPIVQGPVVQSVVSLTSSLRLFTIYNILIFFAEKMWVAFALFFQQKFSAYLRITGCKF